MTTPLKVEFEVELVELDVAAAGGALTLILKV